MNGFNLLRASIRIATGHISHLAASFLMIGALATSSLATPIAFAFDTTVTNVPADFSLLHLPFALSVGQKIEGSYGFATARDVTDIFFPNYPDGLGKMGEVSLNFGEVTAVAPVNFGLAGDGGFYDPAEPDFPASIYLSYDSNTNVVPPWGGVVGGRPWNTLLRLSGPEGTSSSPQQLLDAAIWNKLTSHRQLDFEFVYDLSHQLHYVTVTTTLGDFRAVPEPATLCVLALAILPVLMLRSSWRRGARVLVMLACTAAALLIGERSSQATPITLAFNAIVGPPRQGVDGFVPPSLGVSLQPSDSISGRFTFEPVDAHSSIHETKVTETFPFMINIKSASLVSSQFDIDSSDNVHTDADTTTGDGNSDFDSIEFGCFFNGGGTVCAPNSISPADPTLWTSTISLYGNVSILDGPDIPSDAEIWNRFVPSETFGATFYDPASKRYYGFIATVESFRAVPEPSGAAQAIFLFGVIGAIFAAQSRNRNDRYQFAIHDVRRVIAFIGCSLMLLVSTATARAATYRVELTDITTEAHPDANYLQANFDFGTTFRAIDSVSLELTMPSGYGFSGGTVESFTDSYLRILVHDVGFDLSPHPTGDPVVVGAPRLNLDDTRFAEQDYERMQPNVQKTISFLPYIKDCWSGCTLQPGQVLEYYWPPFFYSGKGAVTLQAYVDFSGDYLNGIPPSTGYGKPPAVTQATLIIEATPTPETSSIGLMLIGVAMLAGRSCVLFASARKTVRA